eukprot:5293463-Pleurochrysis_carterae.AAC.1
MSLAKLITVAAEIRRRMVARFGQAEAEQQGESAARVKYRDQGGSEGRTGIAATYRREHGDSTDVEKRGCVRVRRHGEGRM